MIPYDDLVVALASWRARQGLSGAATAGPGVASAQGRAPAQAAHSAARPAPSRPATSPRPGSHGALDFDEGSLIEEAAYDAAEGGPGGESTNRPDGW